MVFFAPESECGGLLYNRKKIDTVLFLICDCLIHILSRVVLLCVCVRKIDCLGCQLLFAVLFPLPVGFLVRSFSEPLSLYSVLFPCFLFTTCTVAREIQNKVITFYVLRASGAINCCFLIAVSPI